MDWTEAEGKLTRRFTFDDFMSALKFVNDVAPLAEAAMHHPDISFGWGYVVINLQTHDAGRVTEKDHALAKEIDALGA